MIEKKQTHIQVLHTKPQWKMPGYTKNSYFWTKTHVLVPPLVKARESCPICSFILLRLQNLLKNDNTAVRCTAQQRLGRGLLEGMHNITITHGSYVMRGRN